MFSQSSQTTYYPEQPQIQINQLVSQQKIQVISIRKKEENITNKIGQYQIQKTLFQRIKFPLTNPEQQIAQGMQQLKKLGSIPEKNKPNYNQQIRQSETLGTLELPQIYQSDRVFSSFVKENKKIQVPNIIMTLEVFKQSNIKQRLPSLYHSDRIISNYVKSNKKMPEANLQISKSQLMKYNNSNSPKKKISNENFQFFKQSYISTLKCETEIDTNRLRYVARSQVGIKKNRKMKINQDAYLVDTKNEGLGFFSICDGHGKNGHKIAQQVPISLAIHLQKNHFLFAFDQQAVIKKSVFQTNCNIWDSEYDTNLSGSTMICTLITDKTIWAVNVGDSRAILIKQINENQTQNWQIIQLTNDHKPDVQSEYERIISYGGRVDNQRGIFNILQNKDSQGNPEGPKRIWLSFVDCPGLAMSRSLGDQIGSQAGVIAEPEIFEYERTTQDRYMIIASDGLWEQMSNEDVMAIILPLYTSNKNELAADNLITEAQRLWKLVKINMYNYSVEKLIH